MAKKTKNPDKQMALMDVSPKNKKALVKAAEEYKDAAAQKKEWSEAEAEAKKVVLSLVDDADLERLPDGTIRFVVEGMTITITPTEDKLNVKLPQEKRAKGE